MLTSQMSGFIAGAATARIEPAYWHTVNEFLSHAALVTLSVTVTGLLIAALIHFAVVGLSIGRQPDLSTGPGSWTRSTTATTQPLGDPGPAPLGRERSRPEITHNTRAHPHRERHHEDQLAHEQHDGAEVEQGREAEQRH